MIHALTPRPSVSAYDRTPAAAHAASRAAAPVSTALDSEPTWPSECERLALINTVPGGLSSIGEQYLEAAFFVTPRGRSDGRTTSR